METATTPTEDMAIKDMDFVVSPWGKRMSTRIKNGLQRGGIHTLSRLLEYTETDLECLDEGIGYVSIVVINRKLESMGLRLRRHDECR